MKRHIKVIRRSEASPHHLTWDRVAYYVIPMMIGGLIIALWQPLSLVPPLKPFTNLLYAGSALLWLPVFFYFRRHFPTGHVWKQYALLGAGLIPVLIALSLVLGTLTTFNLETKCEPLPSVNLLTRHECRTNFTATETYLLEIFESVPFTPMMWRVEKQNCSLNGCY